MKKVRAAGVAGLVLAAVGVPITGYALAAGEGSDTPSVSLHVPRPALTGPAEPEETQDTDEATSAAPPTVPGQAASHAAAGRDHAAAMKTWARCVAAAASGPKAAGSPTPPKLACGEKPLGPGRAKHLAAGDGSAPGRSRDHRSKTRGTHGAHTR